MSLELNIRVNVFEKEFIWFLCIVNATMGNKLKISSEYNACLVNVYNKSRIPDKLNKTNSGVNIKDFKLTLQKNSFVEIKMNMDKPVKEITGLPQNLYLEKDYIKGVIQKSGYYLLNIMFHDNTQYSFIIEVPNIQRVL